MSYSQQSNNAINFSVNTNKKLDHPGQIHYQPQASNRMQVKSHNMLTSNLDLYIPRVAQGTTEEQIKAVFAHSRIGTVEYCDLSLTKDKDTKKPQYLSAFVRLSSWSNSSGACEDFAKNESIRLYLSRETNEFWILLPNKNPLPRTHVNNSQLAAATDKLFEQTEAIEKKTDKFEDEMRATIAEMRQMMALQQEKIESLEFQLTLKATMTMGEKYPEIFDMKREPVLNDIVYYLEEESEPLDEPLERDFDAEIDALLDAPLMWQIIDNAFSKSDEEEIEKLELKLPIFPRSTAICNFIINADEANEDLDESFLKPIPWLTRSGNSIFGYNQEDECVFSNRQGQGQGQRRSPILKAQPGFSKPLSLNEIVAENPERAIGSRDLCGNL
jgi:hypothetical protein